MTIYRPMTVGNVIDYLETLDPQALLPGLGGTTGSYRGYYEHVAIEPSPEVRVHWLLDEMKKSLGTTMFGYKGGYFPYTRDCLVFVASYSKLGPQLVGFNGLEPVLVEDTF